MNENGFSWQAQYLVMSGRHFWWHAQHAGLSLLVASPPFGGVGKSMFGGKRNIWNTHGNTTVP